ncbi:MAG TPA: UDP-N-acetylmuramate--L-alanine ligase [Myxococcaceae bacterium]|nr:UDP-N-acetylmuramate--L-alanine ligase [Myxococcaceae bacterium]
MDTDPGLLHSAPTPAPKRIHLLGVAGTGMGSFAGMLKQAGYTVTGSDQNVYPPMSDMLRTWGIDAMSPYAAENLDVAKPDLVIVGNVIRRVNPEATAMRERALPHMSFPAALGSLFLAERHSVVVAGTHGKTTTSALLGHVLVHAGRDPSFLVGGVTRDYSSNVRLGNGPHFVVEGDEYDTAYFDKGPKFLHYRARTALLTSVEFDHADIYRDLEHYVSAFAAYVDTVPEDGHLVVCASAPLAMQVAARCRGEVVSYAGTEGVDAHFSVRDVRFHPGGATFEVHENGVPPVTVELPMSGRHNVENAVATFAAARKLGLSAEEIVAGLASFSGVKRRQEPRGEPGGVLVIDDFAHHPTAVKETVAGVHARWPERRLLAVFEPRSNTSRRNIHQALYAEAFPGAARAFLRTPEWTDRVPTGEELDVTRLASDLEAAGVPTIAEPEVDVLVDAVAREARPGDVVLVMSNGAFGGFLPKLLGKLEARAG